MRSLALQLLLPWVRADQVLLGMQAAPWGQRSRLWGDGCVAGSARRNCYWGCRRVGWGGKALPLFLMVLVDLHAGLLHAGMAQHDLRLQHPLGPGQW